MEFIEGAKVRKLKPIHDDRGWLMEILRSDWDEFERFGQVYMTVCNPGVAKGWHYHKKQTEICSEAKMANFKVKSNYEPAGDQGQAIEDLVNSIKENRYQTLHNMMSLCKIP